MVYGKDSRSKRRFVYKLSHQIRVGLKVLRFWHGTYSSISTAKGVQRLTQDTVYLPNQSKSLVKLYQAGVRVGLTLGEGMKKAGNPISPLREFLVTLGLYPSVRVCPAHQGNSMLQVHCGNDINMLHC